MLRRPCFLLHLSLRHPGAEQGAQRRGADPRMTTVRP